MFDTEYNDSEKETLESDLRWVNRFEIRCVDATHQKRRPKQFFHQRQHSTAPATRTSTRTSTSAR
jgi:hypothetical protein